MNKNGSCDQKNVITQILQRLYYLISILEVAVFSAMKGHFVKGQISPAVEGVKIKISNKDNTKQKESVTDKKGQYNIGPLPHDEYDVEASKVRFFFVKFTFTVSNI